MDPFGHSPVLLPDPGLRGPTWSGAFSVLEAWRMVPAMGSQSSVPGCFIHGALPCEQAAAPCQTTGSLLQLGLRQVCSGASDCHGARSWTDSTFHAQKEKGLGVNCVKNVSLPEISLLLKVHSNSKFMLYFRDNPLVNGVIQ